MTVPLIVPLVSTLNISGAALGAPTVPGLTEDEQRLVRKLAYELASREVFILDRFAYYDGEQRLKNLGISIPPQLAGVEIVVDWPRSCVDPLVERTQFGWFRLPHATDVDSDLSGHWAANDMDGELPLAVLDALVARMGYIIVGAPDSPGDSPLVTVESPLNMIDTWDPRTRTTLNAYQAYQVDAVSHAVLYLPGKNIFMSREVGAAGWGIDNVDEHRFGEVSIARLVNRGRSSDRVGRSEITRAVMTTTDSACRSLLGMEIAREVYSIPRLALLGASEDDFVDQNGMKKTPMDMAMTKVLALERDEEGNVPQITQLTAFDPTVFTKIIDTHAQLMSSYTGFPASYFGQVTTANPSSADAIRAADQRIDRRAGQVATQFTAPVRRAGQLIWRYANGGKTIPDALKRLEVDWLDPSTPTPAATTDAVVKQVTVGSVPPTSDVVLARLGYSAVERARLEQDRAADPAQQLLDELRTNIAAKDVIAALRLLKSTGQPVPQATPVPPPDVAAAAVTPAAAAPRPALPGVQAGR